MFEKTLQDVVKGIRANKRDPSVYISQVRLGAMAVSGAGRRTLSDTLRL